MNITVNATNIMKALHPHFVAAGFPGAGLWTFSPSDASQLPAFRELHAHGLIEMHGVGEAEWKLTQAGNDFLLALPES